MLNPVFALYAYGSDVCSPFRKEADNWKARMGFGKSLRQRSGMNHIKAYKRCGAVIAATAALSMAVMCNSYPPFCIKVVGVKSQQCLSCSGSRN